MIQGDDVASLKQNEENNTHAGDMALSKTQMVEISMKPQTMFLDKLRMDGVPKSFLLLIAFCFASGIMALVGFIFFSDGGDSNKGSSAGALLLVVGILNAINGSLQTAAGYACQRLAHKFAERNPSFGPGTKHPFFIIGLLLLATGTIAAVTNLGILGQSVTAPFAACTLIFNGFLANFVLQEVFTKYDFWASCLVIIGVAFAVGGVAAADLEVQSFTLRDIYDLFFRSAFPVIYTIITNGFVILFPAYIRKRNLHETSQGLFCFSACAGMLSGSTSLCVKCAIEILKGSFQRHSGDFGNFFTYLFIIGIPISLVSQLNFMNKGLQYFGTLKFVPLYHAFIIFSNMINGIVYFDEARSYQALSVVLFVGGCLVTVAGVMVLLVKVQTPKAKAVDQGDEEAPKVGHVVDDTDDESPISVNTIQPDDASDS